MRTVLGTSKVLIILITIEMSMSSANLMLRYSDSNTAAANCKKSHNSKEGLKYKAPTRVTSDATISGASAWAAQSPRNVASLAMQDRNNEIAVLSL